MYLLTKWHFLIFSEKKKLLHLPYFTNLKKVLQILNVIVSLQGKLHFNTVINYHFDFQYCLLPFHYSFSFSKTPISKNRHTEMKSDGLMDFLTVHFTPF